MNARAVTTPQTPHSSTLTRPPDADHASRGSFILAQTPEAPPPPYAYSETTQDTQPGGGGRVPVRTSVVGAKALCIALLYFLLLLGTSLVATFVVSLLFTLVGGRILDYPSVISSQHYISRSGRSYYATEEFTRVAFCGAAVLDTGIVLLVLLGVVGWEIRKEWKEGVASDKPVTTLCVAIGHAVLVAGALVMGVGIAVLPKELAPMGYTVGKAFRAGGVGFAVLGVPVYIFGLLVVYACL